MLNNSKKSVILCLYMEHMFCRERKMLIWNLFQEHFLQNNARTWCYLQKTSDLPLNTEIIKQTNKFMMKDEKDLVGEYGKSPVFADYHTFPPASHNERQMEDGIFRFFETKNDNPVMAATNLFGSIINIHPFEDGNGRICHLILAHVLIQMKCCLFPVILSSFHRCCRRHYIRAVKMFDKNTSMLYHMIVKSLIHF